MCVETPYSSRIKLSGDDFHPTPSFAFDQIPLDAKLKLKKISKVHSKKHNNDQRPIKSVVLLFAGICDPFSHKNSYTILPDMSYKFVPNTQTGNYESDSTDNLAIDSNARHHISEYTNNWKMFYDSKSFRIIYCSFSTLTLISGIVCLVLASQMKCAQDIVIEAQNDTKIETLPETKSYSLEKMKVYSPPVPNFLNVSFASGPNHIFVFEGVTTTSTRWVVNFEGKRRSQEIRYHFNPRTEEQQIVRNSKNGNDWSIEQRFLCRIFPFQKGKTFQVKIVVKETKYITYVDGEHYFDYVPTTPNPTDIYFIEIKGGVDMNNITIYEMIERQTETHALH